MELQNINLDFQNNIFSSLTDEKVYTLVESEIMQDFKKTCEKDYSITIERLVIQLTIDQSLSEPRIVFNVGLDSMLIVTLADLQNNFPNTYGLFLALEINVIDQINTQKELEQKD